MKSQDKDIDVIGFLEEHNISHKKVPGKEVIVYPCPVCSTPKKKFYLNTETGLWDCKLCGAQGNFFKFKSLYGVVEGVKSTNDMANAKPLDSDSYEKEQDDLWKSYEAIEYLRSRGFTDETIAQFKLGYKKDGEGEWVAIPHYKDGELWNVKYRRFAGGDKTFRRTAGQPSILFNQDNIDFEKKSVVVVESETDAIACWQMGVRNVVGLTGGAETFKPEWKSFFNRFETVYVVLNSDKVGQKGARKLAEKIGLKKVKNLILPTNDVNDYLTSDEHKVENFKLEFKRATKFEMQNVSSAADIVMDWDDWFAGKEDGISGMATGFKQLDEITHGFKAGDLIIFSGDSGIGKTTCLNNMVSNMLYNGNPVFGFYLEGQMPYMLSRMVGARVGMPYNTLNQDPDKYEQIKKEVSELPLYFFSGSQADLEPETLKEFIPILVELYGVKMIVIDNLQKLVRGSDNMYFQRVSETVSMLKDFAVDYKIPIVLISHVKKVDANERKLTKYDAKSSSTIYQDADLYLILQKVKNEMYITVEKNRMGQDDIDIPLNVDYVLGRFTEKTRTSGPNQAAAEAPADNGVQEIGF